MNLESTSAGGAMHPPVHVFRIVGPALETPGTGAGISDASWRKLAGPPPQTSSGLVEQTAARREPETTSRAINELHRLTGLTWEQLAHLFGVARRSVHFWASGKPLNSRNEVRLRRALAAVRQANRGAASRNRAMLLQDHSGVVPLDLLQRGQYDAFLNLVGIGARVHELEPTPLSPRASAARQPAPPSERVGALQDRVHSGSGKLISSAPIQRKSEG